ncbi:SAV_2336 N-terminal domain-related protein [Streptomyces peucetius]|uniref:non-specific serine/threonine protein kinase n=1 Tax=Streptomyces peucetius TaxID=1950 RepID=A0ABY6IH73_STRPE|nr:SAV_2336 N-terminal domain-related protein [Streptomyces peucetius]UYQ65269.1 SAV_2336 family protein [Streptomyces peucetius]
MLERVRNVLSGDGEELAAEELLDALWLAARLPPAAATALARAAAAAAAPVVSASERLDAGASPADAEDLPGGAQQEVAPAEAAPGVPYRPAARSGLHAAPAAADQQPAPSDRAATAVRAPGMKALGDAELRLGRALRPLRHWRPDTLRAELDVDATVTAMAETGLPEAVLRPARTRWLDLTVLVDDGVSMLLWQRLAGEIKALMERCGAFRHVRIHGLDSRSPDGPRLSRRPFCARAATLPMSTVLDPSGSTLLLVVSDGVGPAWRDGRMHAALLRAAATGPTALVHVLPPRLRAGSGIGAEPWQVTTRRRGAANRSWLVEDPVLPPELAPFDGVPVPVLTTDPSSLGVWAQLVGSAGSTAVLPLLTRPGTGPAVDGRQPAVHGGGSDVTAEAVLRFRDAASPDAYRLAAHLAAVAPLPVPVMRLVQQAVSPAADTSHLAEVFLGGLMHGVEGPGDLPHQRTFDFTEETRRILLSVVPPSELLRTSRAVTTRLTELASTAGGFPAWIPHPHGSERLPAGSRRPFGWVDETVMRRLGLSLPDTAEPTPSKQETAALRELPPGFELDEDSTGWSRLFVSDPRFDGSGALPYEVFAENTAGWSRVGLFLAHDGEGRVLVIRRPEVPHALDLVATEVAALKRMDGLYAPRLLAWDTGCEHPWLAVECALEGRTDPAPDLRSFVERHGPLYEAGLLMVARQFANGLARAHRKGLVHGSLTSHSVLIAGREVQIAGWMTASINGTVARHRASHRQNARYRAPELPGADAEPTQAADIYALGRILVEAAAGVATDEVAGAPDAFELPLGAEIAESLRACLSHDPERRPTAQELLRAFNALAHEREPGKHRLAVTLGLDDDATPVRLDLESAERGGQGPHLLCQGRPARLRQDLLHRVVEQLTRGRDGVELVVADSKGASRLGRYAGRSAGTAFLGLSADPVRPLSLAEKLNAEIVNRRRVLGTTTTERDIGAFETASRRNPYLPALSRLIVAVEEAHRVLLLSPELRTAVTRVAQSGGRLGIHLLLFADSSDTAWLDHRLLQHLRTRVVLLTRPVSDGRFGGSMPDGAVLIDPSASGPVHFDMGRGPADGQSPSVR